MPLPKEAEDRLNRGAALARKEFEDNWENWRVRDVARWWSKWCRREVFTNGQSLNGTNHDRLGRILMDVTGVKRKPPAQFLDFNPFEE